MAKRRNKKVRFVMSALLSFLLSIMLTTATMLAAVKFGFLNKTSVLDGMSRKDYYKSAEAQFYQDAKDFTIPIGLPVEIVDGIVSLEKVHDDICNYVEASVTGKEYVFDTDDLESSLTEHIYDYFEEEGLTMSEEQITTVPEYTKLIAEIYEKDMKVEFVSLLGKINVSYGRYIWMGIGLCLLVSVVIIVMLIRMYHWKHRAVRFVAYAAIATAVLVATPVVLAAVLEYFFKPNISPEHVYYALVYYCSNGMKIFLYFAAGWAAIVGAMLLLIHYLKKHS